MKIFTKTGDKGKTGLYTGKRVSKSSGVIEILGEIDELMAFLGACRVVISMRGGKFICQMIEKIQDDLYRMMATIGGGGEKVGAIFEEDVVFLEKMIEKYSENVKFDGKFVKLGANEVSSRFHIARTVCRRAERRMVGHFGAGEKFSTRVKNLAGHPKIFLKYLNRLSDLLFVMGEKLAS